MSTAPQAYAYISIDKNGRVDGAAMDIPNDLSGIAEFLTAAILAGGTIERVTVEEAREQLFGQRRRAVPVASAPATAVPRRRFLMELRLGADSREDLISELEQIALEMRMGNLNGSCASGGYSTGYSMDVTEDPTVTHDSYIAAINARIEAEKAR